MTSTPTRTNRPPTRPETLDGTTGGAEPDRSTARHHQGHAADPHVGDRAPYPGWRRPAAFPVASDDVGAGRR